MSQILQGWLGNFLWARPTAIENGATKSSAIDTAGLSLCGILLGAFTGTTITFEVSDAIDGTFVPLKSGTSGAALSYTVAANTFAAIDPKDFLGVRFLKIVAGSSQAADRTLKLALKGN